MSSVSSMPTPIIPSFEKAIDASFGEHIVNSMFDYYFSENEDGQQTGEYFKDHVTDHGADTKLFMNVSESLHETATAGVPEADRATSMNMTSAMFVQAVPQILKTMAEQLPSKLEALNWSVKKLDISFYNEKQFRGLDKRTGKPMHGAPACMFVLELVPLPGKVPVCKAKRTFVHKEVEEDEEESPPPKAKSKGTSPYRQAVAAPAAAPAPPAAGGGGSSGKGPFKGKPRPRE